MDELERINKIVETQGVAFLTTAQRDVFNKTRFQRKPEEVRPGGVEDIIPGIGSSASIRQDIKVRGEDPSKLTFGSEKEFTEFKEKVKPEGGIPQREESRVDEFTRLKEEAGIEGLEDKISERESELDKLDENFEKFRVKEAEGQTLGFATGRITEEERNVNDRKRALQREINDFSRRLTTKNNAIETVMNLNELDFQDARKAYEFEFNKNLAIQSAFKAKQTAQMANDRATYNTLVNMFANSGKVYDDLTPKQQQQINELEIRLGIPTGTFQSLATTKPKANIIQSGTSFDAQGNEQAWMIVMGEDGNPEVITTPTGGFKKPAKTPEGKDVEKEEKRTTEFTKADKVVAASQNISDAELKAKLQRETDLNQSEINTLILNRLSNEDIQFEAESYVAEFFNPAALKTDKTDTFEAIVDALADLKNRKTIAIEAIGGGTKNITVTPEIRRRLEAAINAVDPSVIRQIFNNSKK